GRPPDEEPALVRCRGHRGARPRCPEAGRIPRGCGRIALERRRGALEEELLLSVPGVDGFLQVASAVERIWNVDAVHRSRRGGAIGAANSSNRSGHRRVGHRSPCGPRRDPGGKHHGGDQNEWGSADPGEHFRAAPCTTWQLVLSVTLLVCPRI